MSNVAVLGTGTMGAAIARRLLATGHTVTAWNRTPARAARLAAFGARVATDLRDAVAGDPDAARGDADSPGAVSGRPDVVLVMLSDAAAVAAVLAEIAPMLAEDACVVQMSTIAPDETVACAAMVGCGYVDAPVGGSVGAAGTGALRVFAGASEDHLARAEPVLRSLGTVTHRGGVGSGAAAKLVVNAALVGAAAAVHDALLVADAVGVTDAWDLLGGGPLGGALDRLRSTSASFAVALAAKDARLALRAAPDAAVIGAAARLLDGATDPAADIATLTRRNQ